MSCKSKLYGCMEFCDMINDGYGCTAADDEETCVECMLYTLDQIKEGLETYLEILRNKKNAT